MVVGISALVEAVGLYVGTALVDGEPKEAPLHASVPFPVVVQVSHHLILANQLLKQQQKTR